MVKRRNEERGGMVDFKISVGYLSFSYVHMQCILEDV